MQQAPQSNADLKGLSGDLLEKYNTSGPRYTSYPTAPVWQDSFGPEDFENVLRSTNIPGKNTSALSLYAHLPFCESRCLFCGCNVVITQQRDQAEKYLGYLFKEIDQLASLVDTSRPVRQFHWGGGTPTYLSPEQMTRLFKFQTERFSLADDAEVAIEVDPRVTTLEHLDTLKELGFNRISMGVQDFEPKVQEAINRLQPLEMTEAMTDYCRQLGFGGINYDLIYGLPHQTIDTFNNTLDSVIRLNPDRIALYNFAYVPWLSPHQKQMDKNALPSGDVKFQIFRNALEKLTEAGYQYIGMDHFARPEDELAIALKEGSLHRNFMGYTTKAGSEMIAAGVSGISNLDKAYAQNWRKLSDYYDAVEQGKLSTMRGYQLSDDDMLRRQVINSILCQGRLRYDDLNVNAAAYFKDALKQLSPMADDGLLLLDDRGFTLTPLGRIFSRNIAMLFDAYLTNKTDKPIFSKTL